MEVNNVFMIAGVLVVLSFLPLIFVKAKKEFFFFFFFVDLIFVVGAAAFYFATKQMIVSADVLQIVSDLKTAPYLAFAVVAMTVSLFAMIGAFPFHYWILNIMESCETAVAAYMIVIFRAVAILAAMLILEPLASFWGSFLEIPIFILAILTMTVANLNINKGKDLKNILASSSIVHAGFILMLFPSFLIAESDSVTLCIYLLAIFLLIHTGLFLLLVMTKNVPIIGLGKKSPLIGFLIVFFLAAAAGLPPMAGFMGRLFILRSLILGGSFIVIIFFALNILMMVVSVLRPASDIYLKKYPNDADEFFPHIPLMIVIIGFAALLIYLGLAPDSIQSLKITQLF